MLAKVFGKREEGGRREKRRRGREERKGGRGGKRGEDGISFKLSFYHLNDANVHLGRGGEISNQKNAFCTRIVCPKQQTVIYLCYKRLDLQLVFLVGDQN